MKTVQDIVKEYLSEHDYDGLCSNCCGCSLEDFMPCGGEQISGCVPAYKLSAQEAMARGYEEAEDYEFFMVPEVEEKNDK